MTDYDYLGYCCCSQRARAWQHVDFDQLVVSSNSITGTEGGQRRQPSPPTFHSGLPDETLVSEMLPEKDFCDSTPADTTTTTAACWSALSVQRTETVPESGEGHGIQNRKSSADGLPEPLSSVSSQSISQLFSSAGSASSNSSAPASNRVIKSGMDENDGRRNRYRDQDSENRHRDAVGVSRDGSFVLYDDISSRDLKPDEHFRIITSSAAVVLPSGVGDQSLDSGVRRCYSAAAVYSSSSPPIFGADAVERLYYSAANSVQSNCSSRSLTPAGNGSSGSLARNQAEVAKNSFTE